MLQCDVIERTVPNFVRRLNITEHEEFREKQTEFQKSLLKKYVTLRNRKQSFNKYRINTKIAKCDK